MILTIGIDLGYLLGGTIVAEVVFNYPGVGQLAIDSVNAHTASPFDSGIHNSGSYGLYA
ncbi:MAG: hypothetical protein R2855_17980 [Thermomicrobiales bacterium]